AVKAVSRMLLEDHLQSCVVEEIQQGNTEVISEVVDLLKKFS
ncbi:MAG: metal-sensing transcriptional repressor, partial [Atopobium minutum]|nr:metal-sensing transcriptional repressor [Atopobium minutum]